MGPTACQNNTTRNPQCSYWLLAIGYWQSKNTRTSKTRRKAALAFTSTFSY
jgi:hypothetical protein